MKKINHQTFLLNNGLDRQTFSNEVQKKMGIFDQMYAKLDQTVAEDHATLKTRLKALDREIYADMLEELEDRLENNEEMEEEQKQHNPKSTLQVSGSTDENILDELKNIGRVSALSRSTLRKYGIKTRLSGWEITIGKHTLKRASIWDHSYNLY